MENIKKIAKSIKKELGKEVNIKTISSALTRRGFTLLYLDSEEGAEQLQYYKLTQYAKNKKCFTYISSVKLVFVDGTLHKNDIIKLLLHELAHIELHHIGYTDHYVYDEVSAEVEADAVVYNVLNSDNTKHITAAAIIIAILLLNIIGISTIHQRYDTTAPAPVAAEQQHSQDIPVVHSDIPDTVYVTRTGKKFHRESCRYVKTDGVKPISRGEAIKNYTPCKICTP